MLYTKPTVTSTYTAVAAIQGDKNGLPDDSNGIDTRSVGAAYSSDE